MSHKQKTVVNEVIAVFGTAVKLAKSLNITAQAIHCWKSKGEIPRARCIEIEKATGIACERLNPSIDWSYLRREGAARN